MKDSIVQGFQWATREGPLCDERKTSGVLNLRLLGLEQKITGGLNKRFLELKLNIKY